MEKVIHIIPWSGGPDSTYQLKKILDNKKENEIIVSISGTMTSTVDCDGVFSNLTRHSELEARNNLTPILKKINDFDRLEIETHEAQENRASFSHVTNLTSYSAFKYKPDRGYSYLCRCADDATRDPTGILKGSSMRRYNRRAAKIFKDLYNIEIKMVNEDVSKADIRKYLKELWDMTYSCYTPKEILKGCGNCLKCRERKIAGGPWHN